MYRYFNFVFISELSLLVVATLYIETVFICFRIHMTENYCFKGIMIFENKS